MSISKPLQSLQFGAFPVALVNRLLRLELEPGGTVMSAGAQPHARRRHGEDYSRSLPHVAGVINSPLYIGDDFRNAGKIELVGRPPGWDDEALLIAVEIIRDAGGNYNIVSCYPISETKVQSRREKGRLASAAMLMRKGPLVA